MSEFKNLIFAVLLSSLIMLGWNVISSRYFNQDTNVIEEGTPTGKSALVKKSTLDHFPVHFKNRDDLIKSTKKNRIHFSNKLISGSWSTKGARLDDVSLLNYHDTVDKSSPNTVLFSPEGSRTSYFVEFGWTSSFSGLILPDSETIWKVKGVSDNGKSFDLVWDNSAGVVFGLKVRLDENYMFNVKQYVKNNTSLDVSVVPYAKIRRLRDDKTSYWISHEGFVSVDNTSVKSLTYNNMLSDGLVSLNLKPNDSRKSWFGFSDKYWFSAIIPTNFGSNRNEMSVNVLAAEKDSIKHFQALFSFVDERVVSAGSSIENDYMLFSGAKELALLDNYKSKFSISLFDKAVDFGSIYFITKPVFLLLQYINSIVKNFGLSIIILTIIVKGCMFPLAYRSHVSMLKIKSLSPEIERIRKMNAGSVSKANAEIAKLFSKNSVSPISGFLPVLFQIPFFFALYKVLFVTIEMRHASFFLWIKDLSFHDPANILDLFGFLNYSPPVTLGVLPVFLGITMLIQQKVSGSVGVDKNQAAVMKLMPYIFMFVFSSFPAGLVIYWSCSNIITILQYIVMNFIISKSKSKSSVINSAVDSHANKA